MEYASREALIACLEHVQRSAGNASLMTAELINTLAEHALGNYRVLTTVAAELLATAAQHERPQLDEQLYLEVVGTPPTTARKRA
jgi:general secretion pathway protein A